MRLSSFNWNEIFDAAVDHTAESMDCFVESLTQLQPTFEFCRAVYAGVDIYIVDCIFFIILYVTFFVYCTCSNQTEMYLNVSVCIYLLNSLIALYCGTVNFVLFSDIAVTLNVTSGSLKLAMTLYTSVCTIMLMNVSWQLRLKINTLLTDWLDKQMLLSW